MPVEPIALDSDDSSNELLPPSKKDKGKKRDKDKSSRSKDKSRSKSREPSSSLPDNGKGKQKEASSSKRRDDRSSKAPSSAGSSRSVSANTNAKQMARSRGAAPSNGADADVESDSGGGTDDDDDDDDESGATNVRSSLKRLRCGSSTPKPQDVRSAKVARTQRRGDSEGEVEDIIRSSQTVLTDKGKARAIEAEPVEGGSSSPLTTEQGDAAHQQPLDPTGTDANDGAHHSGSSSDMDESTTSSEHSESDVYRKGEPFYTSSEGSLHETDDEEGLGSWTKYDQRHWQGDDSHLIKAYNNEYPLRGVLRHRKHKKYGYVQYRIWWSGFPIYSTTWEPETMFNNKETMEEYWARQGGRPADCPPPPRGWKFPYDSEDTDIAQCRRPRQKAHEALRKRRYQIRKDKYDARKLEEGMSDVKRKKDEKLLRRLERMRSRRNITLDLTRRRDSDDEDHIRSIQRRQREKEKKERKLKKWRRSQQQNGNGAGPSSVFGKNFSSSSKVLLEGVSMRGTSRAAPLRTAKTRAADMDDLPSEHVEQKAFRPAPAPAARPPVFRSAQPPPQPKPDPPPKKEAGSYKGAHHRAPKTIVLNDEAIKKKPRPAAPVADDPWSRFLAKEDDRPSGSTSGAASGAWSPLATNGNCAPSQTQSHVHPSRQEIVPGSSSANSNQVSTSFASNGWESPVIDGQSWQPQPQAVIDRRTALASSTTGDPRRRLSTVSPMHQQPPAADLGSSLRSPNPSSTSPRSPMGVQFDLPPGERSGWSPEPDLNDASTGAPARDAPTGHLSPPLDRSHSADDHHWSSAQLSRPANGAPQHPQGFDGYDNRRPSPQPPHHVHAERSFDRPSTGRLDAAPPSQIAGGVGLSPPPGSNTLWQGRVDFVLGDRTIGFPAHLAKHGGRSMTKAVEMGFDTGARRLFFDRVFPMPLVREIIDKWTTPTSSALLLEAQGPALQDNMAWLETVSRALLEADMLIVCRMQNAPEGRNAYMGVFSGLYTSRPPEMPFGYRTLVSAQLWAVPIELNPDAAASAVFFRPARRLHQDVADVFKAAMAKSHAALQSLGLKETDISRAEVLTGRYQLVPVLIDRLRQSYNLIYPCPRDAVTDGSSGAAEVKAIYTLIRIYEGGFRGELDGSSEKLWRGQGKRVTVYLRNASTYSLFDGSSASFRSPLAEYLRRLKRCADCKFFGYGFDPRCSSERFKEVFPLDQPGLVTISLSALLSELFKEQLSAAEAEEGQLDASQASQPPASSVAEAISSSLPPSWRFLVHPWLLSTLRLLEPRMQETLEGLGIFAPGQELGPLMALEEEIEAFSTADSVTVLALGDIKSAPFDEPTAEALSDPVKLVRDMDEEIFKTMMKTQAGSMAQIRYHVYLAGRNEERKSEMDLAGIEWMTVDEAVRDGMAKLSGMPGN